MTRKKTTFEIDIASKVDEIGAKEAVRRLAEALKDEDERTFVGEDGVRYRCSGTDCYCDDLKPGENCRNWKSIEQRTAEVTGADGKVAKVSLDETCDVCTEPCSGDRVVCGGCLQIASDLVKTEQRRPEAQPVDIEAVAAWVMREYPNSNAATMVARMREAFPPGRSDAQPCEHPMDRRRGGPESIWCAVCGACWYSDNPAAAGPGRWHACDGQRSAAATPAGPEVRRPVEQEDGCAPDGEWEKRFGPMPGRAAAPPVKHVCGLTGFGALGDVCAACEARNGGARG